MAVGQQMGRIPSISSSTFRRRFLTNQGNLLVDFSILGPAEGTLFLDSEATDVIQSVAEINASAAVARLRDNEIIPVQFTFATGPQTLLGDYSGNQLVEQADLDLVLLH